ncbi:MAG: Wzz/FepE/Etk N-terminal domain-containing protein [Alistipes sp.]
MNKQNNETPNSEEQEIDLLDLIRKIWFKRKTIFKITGAFIFIALLIAIFSAKSYTASCEIVPQSNRNMSSSSMARLASMAGLNLGSMNSIDQVLSPMVYPNILSSVAFQRELLQSKINIQSESEPITLLTYLTDKQYRRFSLIGFVLKYTIGLPGLVVHAIKGDAKEEAEPITDSEIIVLTKEERQAVKMLNSIINTKLEEKKGYITIVAQMPEPYAAAQVAESTLKLLEKYITEFKIDKVKSNLEFVQGRYDDLKKEYESVQMARARYKDANQNTSTSRARTELERLDNQYRLAYNIFSEMATQLEQAKIQVKETTPVLTVIDPVSMPTQPSKPNRLLILIGFTFLGLVIGCCYVLFAPFVRDIFNAQRKENVKPEATQEN